MSIFYYKQLYLKEPNVHSQPTLNFPRLSRGSQWWLNRELIDQEIKEVTFRIGAHKTLRPDGLPAYFFQKSWPLIEESISLLSSIIFFGPDYTKTHGLLPHLLDLEG